MNGKNLSPPNFEHQPQPTLDHPEVKKLIRKKRRVYNKAKKSNCGKHRAAFKEIQNRTRDALRVAHWDYVKHMLKKGLDKGDSNQFWNYLKAQRQDSQGVAPPKRRKPTTC